jgi:hypothetical protein
VYMLHHSNTLSDAYRKLSQLHAIGIILAGHQILLLNVWDSMLPASCEATHPAIPPLLVIYVNTAQLIILSFCGLLTC